FLRKSLVPHLLRICPLVDRHDSASLLILFQNSRLGSRANASQLRSESRPSRHRYQAGKRSARLMTNSTCRRSCASKARDRDRYGGWWRNAPGSLPPAHSRAVQYTSLHGLLNVKKLGAMHGTMPARFASSALSSAKGDSFLSDSPRAINSKRALAPATGR